MKNERYEIIRSSSDSEEFHFISEGPNGKINMKIQFIRTFSKSVFNLTFGNLSRDGSINDKTIINNKDRNKILATVAAAVYEFSSVNPGRSIFFCGSTHQRNRLYRMALTVNLTELQKDFRIYGLLREDYEVKKETFQKGMDYFGFLIKRKKVILKNEEA